jgi:hypothetical protein
MGMFVQFLLNLCVWPISFVVIRSSLPLIRLVLQHLFFPMPFVSAQRLIASVLMFSIFYLVVALVGWINARYFY